jgi:hypothetical protein
MKSTESRSLVSLSYLEYNGSCLRRRGCYILNPYQNLGTRQQEQHRLQARWPVLLGFYPSLRFLSRGLLVVPKPR